MGSPGPGYVRCRDLLAELQNKCHTRLTNLHAETPAPPDFLNPFCAPLTEPQTEDLQKQTYFLQLQRLRVQSQGLEPRGAAWDRSPGQGAGSQESSREGQAGGAVPAVTSSLL